MKRIQNKKTSLNKKPTWSKFIVAEIISEFSCANNCSRVTAKPDSTANLHKSGWVARICISWKLFLSIEFLVEIIYAEKKLKFMYDGQFLSKSCNENKP